MVPSVLQQIAEVLPQFRGAGGGSLRPRCGAGGRNGWQESE